MLSPELAERLYHEMGALIGDPPDFREPNSPDVHRWLGRVLAILQEVPQSTYDVTEFRMLAGSLDNYISGEDNRGRLMGIPYRTLARLERMAPVSSSNAFIGAGASFDALTSLGKVLGGAQNVVLFVDPYAGANLLRDYAVLVPERVTVQVLGVEGQVKADIEPAARAWKAQHSLSRPLEIRIAPRGQLHDRAVFLDDKVAWTIGTSFNGLGKKSPTLLQKVDQAEVFPEKLSAYRSIWGVAQTLA